MKTEMAIATYVIADIHGEYDKFIELLDKIKLKETDILYILGDILDRGPHPIKTLLKLMKMPNVGRYPDGACDLYHERYVDFPADKK